MTKCPIGNNRGMALLLTLTIISLLVVFTLELNRRVRSAVQSIAIARDRIALSQMAASGIHVAMAVLVRDKMDSKTDSVQEEWADSENFNQILDDFLFERGNVRIKINDETGKIQVNALVKFPDKNAPNDPQMFLWERFLTRYIAEKEVFDDIEPRSIINAIKDWIDTGDDEAVTGLTGAESGYYNGLDPGYPCRNDRIPHLSDLALVKGMSRDLLYGIEEFSGISEHLTVHGMVKIGSGFAYPGKINISTAQLPVLNGLMPLGYEEFGQAIFDYREEISGDEYANDISDPSWYKNVPGFSLFEGKKLTEFQSLITTSSDIYSIEATALLDGIEFVLKAVVNRVRDQETGKWRCRVLSWQTL